MNLVNPETIACTQSPSAKVYGVIQSASNCVLPKGSSKRTESPYIVAIGHNHTNRPLHWPSPCHCTKLSISATAERVTGRCLQNYRATGKAGKEKRETGI